MRTIRAVSAIALVVMLAAIVYGVLSGDFGDDGSAIWGLPWGRVTLIDLYVGLLLFGVWIAYREGNRGVVLAWWVALATLGNLAAAIYLVKVSFATDSARELLTGAGER